MSVGHKILDTVCRLALWMNQYIKATVSLMQHCEFLIFFYLFFIQA